MRRGLTELRRLEADILARATALREDALSLLADAERLPEGATRRGAVQAAIARLNRAQDVARRARRRF